MDVYNAGFKICRKMSLKMFHEEGNAFSTFVKARENTPCVLVTAHLHRSVLILAETQSSGIRIGMKRTNL